jgi:hypothetical protein
MAFMFENLDVYQKAVDFADEVATLTATFPRGYYFLTDQLNRAFLRLRCPHGVWQTEPAMNRTQRPHKAATGGRAPYRFCPSELIRIRLSSWRRPPQEHAASLVSSRLFDGYTGGQFRGQRTVPGQFRGTVPGTVYANIDRTE